MERVVIQVGILGTRWWQLSYQDELQRKYVEDIVNCMGVVLGRKAIILDDLMVVLLRYLGSNDVVVVDHQNKLQLLYVLGGAPAWRK
jgi:hypothetical protein